MPSVMEPWEKPGSVWGSVLLWSDKTCMVWFNSRLQHRSDCAEDLSGSCGLVLMVIEVYRGDMVSDDIQGCRGHL